MKKYMHFSVCLLISTLITWFWTAIVFAFCAQEPLVMQVQLAETMASLTAFGLICGIPMLFERECSKP